jgi:hypothetical protein
MLDSTNICSIRAGKDSHSWILVPALHLRKDDIFVTIDAEVASSDDLIVPTVHIEKRHARQSLQLPYVR